MASDTATVIDGYGAGSTFYSGGSTYDTITPNVDFTGAQEGDVIVNAAERNHTSLPLGVFATPPTGWSNLQVRNGAHHLQVMWYRIGAGELGTSWAMTLPVNAWSSWWSGLVRSSFDPDGWAVSGGDHQYSGTPADKYGTFLAFVGEIQNNPQQPASPGWSTVFYSPTIQHEANHGVYVSDDNIPPNIPLVSPYVQTGGFVPNKARLAFLRPGGWRVGSIGFG